MANKEWLYHGADGLTFGERLEDLIKLNKTTAIALASETGLAQSAISEYLNKDRAPDCGTICALAQHFSVSTDYLLGIESIPATDLTVKDIHNKTGLSEENISRLIMGETHASGFTYADFANGCLNATYPLRGYFYMMAQAMISKMEHEEAKANNCSVLTRTPDDYTEIVKAMDAAGKQAQEVGCALLTHDESIRFYAREIASDLERYLLGVFNNGND